MILLLNFLKTTLKICCYFLIFIYLTGLGLNCSTWDLVSWPGIEPRLPDWKLRVLATGSPEKSILLSFDDFRGTENNHYTNHPENRKRGITSFPKTGVINFKPRQYQDKKRKPESFVLLSVNVKNLNTNLNLNPTIYSKYDTP